MRLPKNFLSHFSSLAQLNMPLYIFFHWKKNHFAFTTHSSGHPQATKWDTNGIQWEQRKVNIKRRSQYVWLEYLHEENRTSLFFLTDWFPSILHPMGASFFPHFYNLHFLFPPFLLLPFFSFFLSFITFCFFFFYSYCPFKIAAGNWRFYETLSR